MSESTLIAHKDTALVSYTDLANIATPKSTQYWRPVSHLELVDTLKGELAVRGLEVIKEQYAVGHNGMKLFGTFDLAARMLNGIGSAIGFRHSNDKSLALQTIGGARVFVCDNMAFSGEMTILKHKHTWGFNLLDLIRHGLDRWQNKEVAMVGDIQRLQSLDVTEQQAQALLGRLLYDGKVTFQAFKLAYDLFLERSQRTPEQYPDCAPRTVWGLHNALTRALKESTPNVAFNSTIELGKVFGIGTEPTYAMAA